MSRSGGKRNQRREAERIVRMNHRLEEQVAGHSAEGQALRREVSLRKRLEEELRTSNGHLRRLNKDLERANKELDSFAFAISHDLQAPLNHCASYLRFLEEDQSPPLNEEAQGHLKRAQSAAQRMNAMIVGVLDYARARELVKVEHVSLASVVEEAVENLSTLIAEYGAELNLGPMPTVSGNRTRLVQLFQNLIQNSLRYRSERPLQVNITAIQRPGGWTVGVEDNGIGMDPHIAQDAFRLFRRMNTKSSGTGVGLALCKQIAEAHGGRIDIQTEVDVGSRFLIQLPTLAAKPPKEPARKPAPPPAAQAARRAVPERQATSRSAPPPPQRSSQSRPLRILIADDSPLDRALLRRLVLSLGLDQDLQECSDGAQAISAQDEDPFDVILLDYELHDIEGPTILRAFGSLGETLVLGLSRQGGEEWKRRMLEAGACQVFSKDILWAPDLVRDQLESLLREAIANIAASDSDER